MEIRQWQAISLQKICSKLLAEHWKELYATPAKLVVVVVLFCINLMSQIAIFLNILNLIQSISFNKNISLDRKILAVQLKFKSTVRM